MWSMRHARLFGPHPWLVGREREQQLLAGRLDGLFAGHGGLVLIAGPAGVGKTALTSDFAATARDHGARTLLGGAHELTETPPYGPWLEALHPWPPDPDLATVAAALGARGGEPRADERHRAPTALAEIFDLIAELTLQRPLMLVLEDLHWADAASLELLRIVARRSSSLSLLLVATHRTHEPGQHALEVVLPALIRESDPERIELRPLDTPAVRTLVRRRYSLRPPDEARLVSYLQRAEGNPFFIGELLHALEQAGVLTSPPERGAPWTVGDLSGQPVPRLLRQVVAARLAQLDAGARSLLDVAAVVGQEVPLTIWAAASGIDEEALIPIVERMTAANILVPNPDGARVHFAHDLIRAIVYESILPPRLRRWHQMVARVLVEQNESDADAIAAHLVRAGDPAAAGWLLRASDHAERVGAWRTAAERLEAALALLEQDTRPMVDVGWQWYRLAQLRRYADPQGAMQALDRAASHAAEAGDRLLAARVAFTRGFLLCFTRQFGPGIACMEASLAELESLPPPAEDTVRMLEGFGLPHDLDDQRGKLALWLALVGRYAEARELGAPVAARLATRPPCKSIEAACAANALFALGWAETASGSVAEARALLTRTRMAHRALGDTSQEAAAALGQLWWVELSYAADSPATLEALTAEACDARRRAADASVQSFPEELALLPTFWLHGSWSEAQRLAEDLPSERGGGNTAVVIAALGRLALARGDSESGRQLIHRHLPDGPGAIPGTSRHLLTQELQRVAAALALEGGDLPTAHAWLTAHDRWLAWSNACLGRAEGALLWSTYSLLAGDRPGAERHAERALTLASAPRQPLALLAAHRMMGQLAATAGRRRRALDHLDRALVLADACGTPYERGLTLLAAAEAYLALGQEAEARVQAIEASRVLDVLGARPALARALAIVDGRVPAARISAPAGLTPREMEILRLLAAGRTNREIAAELVLSIRTVNRHVANVYAKIDAHGRADATAYAVRNGLV